MPSTASLAHVTAAAERLWQRLVTVQLREPRITVGIDVGSSAVKAVALGGRRGSQRRALLGHAVVPRSGEDDPAPAIRAAVEQLKVPAKAVAVSVSGPWVVMRIIELPSMSPAELRQALPFETQRYLPFPLSEVVIDGVELGSSGPKKSWILVVACRKELLDRRLDGAKRAGLEIGVVDVDALALTNAFWASRNGHAPAPSCALVNVGAQLSSLVVLHDGVPHLVRDIPWGMEKLSRAVGELAGREAAAVHQALVDRTLDDPLREALTAACETFAAELQLSFDYVENRFGQPPGELLVSGGVSASEAFLEAMKSHLPQAVSAWRPAEGLPAQATVAYGLALRIE